MTKAESHGDGVLATETGSPTEDLPSGILVAGQVLGDRYEVRSLLGRGGMGEVWRAFDLKLRVEVALKAMRADWIASESRRELLRREVRAAREVVSPNVCRIFDLIEVEDRELVSMEYVDGATLLAVLEEQGPMELAQAQDVASQFLAGLEAIHAAGLVHRDVKPENIMITRSGRVVVMDFGLARQTTEGGGTVSGTPAYMSPEQASGDDLDARADVYAAGVVLAEMVSPEGVGDHHSRKSLWEAVRSEPPRVPDSPWAAVIRRAVARDREQRPRSAHTLIRELEEVTLRVAGAEDLTPYPGLASFTESDAEYFFGREAEVESMWARLEGPARLLGLVGPSGAGKTSFVRAGVMPAAPAGWSVLRCTPGGAATSSLRRALIPELAGDPEILQGLVDSDDDEPLVTAVARWRDRRDHALLVVDQFEEVFTQNPPEEQARFAALLEQLALRADVHVLLSLRDDFLAQCNAHEPLRPVFHELAVLDPPAGANLRRALVQPATRCGYRFADEALVDEMLGEVEGERGALPLLAFAAAQLWERRDRESGVLTREAYDTVGGVGGALGRHAEATIDRIGAERVPVVREMFRNLVTAEGTRAVREWDELLSVFGGPNAAEGGSAGGQLAQRVGTGGGWRQPRPYEGTGSPDESQKAAEEVLRALVDARLLTAYEIHDDERDPVRRVEIIHESLLANWPRLVRWQTQDADAAQLRDQLRQAARTWEEHGRSDDLLWTGAAYREFAVWREGYAGGLSAVEQAFATSMAAFATRRNRRRRFVAGVVVVSLAVISVIFGDLWRRSAREARRAEAAHLRSRAQLEPTISLQLAYAMASLELWDDPQTRRFCMRALSREPTEIHLPDWVHDMVFSPDGKWVLVSNQERGIELWPRDGGAPITLVNSEGCGAPKEMDWNHWMWISPDSDAVGAYCRTDLADETREFRVWPVGAGAEPTTVDLSRLADPTLSIRGFGSSRNEIVVARWYGDGGIQRVVWGTMTTAGTQPPQLIDFQLPVQNTVWARADDFSMVAASPDEHQIHVASVTTGPRMIGRQESRITSLALSPQADRVASLDDGSVVRLWSTERSGQPIQTYGGGASDAEVRLQRFSPDGNLLVSGGISGRHVMWNLNGPPDAIPVELGSQVTWGQRFDPAGRWLVLKEPDFSLRPLQSSASSVISSPDPKSFGLVFEESGDHLYSADFSGSIYRWPLRGASGDASEVVFSKADAIGVRFFPRFHRIALDPKAHQLAAAGILSTRRGTTRDYGVTLFSLVDGTHRQLEGTENWPAFDVAFDAEGRRLAAGLYFDAEVKLWDLVSGELSRFEFEEPPKPDGSIFPSIVDIRFLNDGDLMASTLSGNLWRIDTQTGDAELVSSEATNFDLSRDERQLLSCFKGSFAIQDLQNGTARPLPLPRAGEWVAMVLDPSGAIAVSADNSLDTGNLGVLRVSPVNGADPHLLFGPQERVYALAIAPDGATIAASMENGTIQLWPMPDVSRPPMQNLPLNQLLSRLGAFTNARVVRDESAADGYLVHWAPVTRWPAHPDD